MTSPSPTPAGDVSLVSIAAVAMMLLAFALLGYFGWRFGLFKRGE